MVVGNPDAVLSGDAVTDAGGALVDGGGTGAAATVIASDLSKPGAAATLVHEIASRGLVIEILINNAGLGATGRFDRNDPARISEILQVNVVALSELTRLMLPGMIARGHGRVMLVASVAAFQPGPRMAAYFASKAYVLSLGEALAYELRGTGVKVLCVNPGPVPTEFGARAGVKGRSLAPDFLSQSAEDVAQAGYRGLMRGQRTIVPGPLNKLLVLLIKLFPRRVAMAVVDRRQRRRKPASRT